jgi:FKBP-type peptidyl-prolyl cis-trans isomerase (trigger factor)
VVKEMKEIAQSRIILRFGMQELANALEIEPAEDAMKAQLDSARASAKAEGHALPEEELKSGGGVYEQVRWEQRMQGILKKMIGE